MSRLIFVLVAFASMSFVDGDSNQSEKIKNLFQAELACRENLKSSATWPIYVFCAIPILMSGLQIAVLSILLWYIRKKMSVHVEHVIEKTHMIMDAVLVTLMPQSLMLDITEGPSKKKGKDTKNKSAEE